MFLVVQEKGLSLETDYTYFAEDDKNFYCSEKRLPVAWPKNVSAIHSWSGGADFHRLGKKEINILKRD